MKRLKTLAIDGLRNLRGVRMELPRLLAVAGPNGSGKTSLFTAIRLLVQGYEPELGKTLAATRRVMAPNAKEIDVAATFDDGFGARRRFIAKGGASMTEEIEVAPPRGEVTLDDRAARITDETGASVFSFDLGAFLELSAEKRKEKLFAVLPRANADLDEIRFRKALGYTEADDATRRAITHLWTEHVVANTSAVEGLASAIDAARRKVNDTEDDRRKKAHHVEELDANAARSSEAVADFDSAEIGRLQAELAGVDEAIGRAQQQRTNYERARAAVRRHGEQLGELERRHKDAIAAAHAAEERVSLFTAQLVDTTPLEERASTATRKARGQREAVSYHDGEARTARAEVARVRAALTQLSGHERCPTCGSADTLAAARALLEEQAAAAAARVETCTRELAEAQARLADFDATERQAARELDVARRVVNDHAIARAAHTHHDEMAAQHDQDLRRLRGNAPADPGQEPDALDEALQTSAADLRARLAALRAQERAAAKAERDRELATAARAALDLLDRKVSALKRLHRGLQVLRTEVIASMVGPVEKSANELLQLIDSAKVFQFVLEADGKKTEFDFGFVEGGVFRSFDAASTGEDAFLAIVFVAAMLDALGPAWPVLLVDNVEAIDPERRRWVMLALAKAADRFGNVVVCGCCEFDAVEGWQIVDMQDITGARAQAAA